MLTFKNNITALKINEIIARTVQISTETVVNTVYFPQKGSVSKTVHKVMGVSLTKASSNISRCICC